MKLHSNTPNHSCFWLIFNTSMILGGRRKVKHTEEVIAIVYQKLWVAEGSKKRKNLSAGPVVIDEC